MIQRLSKYFISLPSVVGFVFIIVADLAGADELLRNPGFEGHANNGIAAGWKDNSGWADVDVEYVLDEGAIDGKSQHIIIQRIVSGEVQFVQPHIPLSKGQSYRISIWVKGRLDSPLEIMLRQQGTPYTVYARKAFRVSKQWKQYDFIATAGVDDPGIFFMVRFIGRGEVWLDKATMQKVSATEVAPSPDKVNLIPNGSFEVGVDRWAVKIRETGGYRYEMPIAFADPRPEIATGQVPHGEQAMHIDVPHHGRVIVTTPKFKVSPGHRYTLSLWLKGDSKRKVRMDLNSAGYGAHVRLGREVDVGPQWERYHFSVTLPSGGDLYYLQIESKGPGGLSIDGVQVVVGEGRRFQPRQPIEIGLSRPTGSPIYYKNDAVTLELCLSAHKSLDGDYKVQVSSIDFYGEEIGLFEQQFSFDSANNLCRSFSHPTNRTGHFRIHAEVQEKKVIIDQAAMAIGIVPKSIGQQGMGSPFGGHARFSPASLEAMKMLGVSWLRMHPPLGTKWFIVEPEKNRFEFFDESILFAKAQGFHILGSLDSSPRWASSAPKDLKTEQVGGFRSYPPNEMSDWENYVSRTVAHYNGVVDHWEIWNEPDRGDFFKLNSSALNQNKSDVYVRLVKLAYKAAKQANPNVTIVAGVGTEKPPSRWLSKLVKKGILDYLDAFSFHYYLDGRSGDVLDVTTGDRVAELRSIMNAGGRDDIPIWESESGFVLETCGLELPMDENSYCASPQTSVAFIMRNYLEWISSGVDHWFFYHMFFPDRTDRTRLSGFFDWDRSPKPLALGYATLSWILQDAAFNRVLPESGGLAGAEFTADDRVIRIFWASDWATGDGKTLHISCSDRMKQTIIIDAMGNQIADCATTDGIDLKVNSVPVFVIDSVQQ